MKTYTTTCDICGRVVEPADVRSLVLAGVDKEIDVACYRATLAIHADATKWEAERDAEVRKIGDEKAAAEAAVVVV